MEASEVMISINKIYRDNLLDRMKVVMLLTLVYPWKLDETIYSKLMEVWSWDFIIGIGLMSLLNYIPCAFKANEWERFLTFFLVKTQRKDPRNKTLRVRKMLKHLDLYDPFFQGSSIHARCSISTHKNCFQKITQKKTCHFFTAKSLRIEWNTSQCFGDIYCWVIHLGDESF